MFERPHHKRIATLLDALDGGLFRDMHCYFGGGTAIALRYGEYRESVGVDFVVSDRAGYREMRRLAREHESIAPFLREGVRPFSLSRDMRADQYGIRAMVDVEGAPVKFEIILEGRVELALPGGKDVVCGVPTLTPLDMAVTKLLANSDRWADASVFSRDVIDLAMMQLPLSQMRKALEKAEQAYGGAVSADLQKAVQRLENQEGVLDRCMQAMAINVPKAVLWQNIRKLKRVVKE